MTTQQKGSKVRRTKEGLPIPDLEHSKRAVRNPLPAKSSQES
jgi:hypothetical protein